MQLNDEQRARVSQWLAEGLKLSDIQSRVASELGLKLTYMEVRFLLDDLKLTPKAQEPAPAPTPAPATRPPQPGTPAGGTPTAAPAPGAAPGSVSVSVDTLTRPGALISGKVTFSDGNSADWYLDQTGRLGLVPKKEGYRPAAADVEAFQMALERELSRAGL
jgi:glyoxylase-like metal-dependent hydrolase (beta-lactamase superfamily II)